MKTSTTLLLALSLCASAARAEEEDPRVEHVPVAAAVAGVPILAQLRIRHLERVARVEARWRARPEDPWRVVVAERDSAAWRAVIPAQPATVRSVQYHLVLIDVSGREHASFASAAAPHEVVVHRDDDDREEAWDLARARGRRIEFTAGGEYTNFGAVQNANGRCGAAAVTTCEDWYFSAWGMVRYRFHRTVRSVAVRVERLEGRTTRDGQLRDVGLVAADTEVEFRLARPVSLTVLATLGANEVSVQGGGGVRLDVGVGSPAVVSLSFHGITNYGLSAAAWLRFETVRDTPIGAGIEATNQPGSSGAWGARLLLEVGRHFGRHVTVTLRGGYGARQQEAGGFTGGGAFTLAF